MSRSEHLDSPPIKAIYTQPNPNSPINFGSLKVTTSEFDHGTDSVVAQARLRFTPDDSLEFEVPPSDNSISLAAMRVGREAIKLILPEHGTSFDVFCKSSSTERSIYVPKRSPIQIRQKSTAISRVTFHLMNWPDFWGPDNCVLRIGDAPGQGAKTCGRVLLDIGGWKITIAATEQTDALVKALAENGGYVITHVGSIVREDETEFSTDELDDLLTRLHYFFSFVLGRWTGPSLSVGFDASGNRVFDQWGLGKTAHGPWVGSRSWFDSHHSEFFSQIMPGFWALWNDDTWQGPLTEAIYWYNAANQAGSGIGVDTAILLTQAALELLSWTYCVRDRRMVSANAFKSRGLSAADKLRLLVSSLGIPLQIPTNLSALHAKQGKKWEDSMDAITDLRNGLVHPGKKKKVPEGAYYDAWRLSLWYIDLVLLRLCGHRGKYANRLAQRWVGEVELVPWE